MKHCRKRDRRPRVDTAGGEVLAIFPPHAYAISPAQARWLAGSLFRAAREADAERLPAPNSKD